MRKRSWQHLLRENDFVPAFWKIVGEFCGWVSGGVKGYRSEILERVCPVVSSCGVRRASRISRRSSPVFGMHVQLPERRILPSTIHAPSCSLPAATDLPLVDNFQKDLARYIRSSLVLAHFWRASSAATSRLDLPQPNPSL